MSGPVAQPAAKEELPLLGEEFAVEFANSLYRSPHEHLDFLATPPAVRSWFSLAQPAAGLTLPREVSAELARDLRSVRDAVRALLEHAAAVRGPARPPYGPETATAVQTLHASARRARAHLILEASAGSEGPGWTLSHEGPLPDVLVAATASRCILFLGGEDIGNVRICARPGCPMLFVRRHRARRYCHESCGHNLRQARYYRARTVRTAAQ
ncbi:ABATE domain-containing protein [Actinoplanes sp. NEAU-A12]|uniref:ABATE domain-containing protein n=1 Tax=Actinoplanes sandaracinus TaxID=3045177 RepID=A0ABT6WYG5_9ACTN|nr:ABATE domain-containing protein [Actinoplanes sandaracinus]MDI6104788.1 ABATE domain-containing protein [Actinoplanes sandaracinus]